MARKPVRKKRRELPAAFVENSERMKRGEIAPKRRAKRAARKRRG